MNNHIPESRIKGQVWSSTRVMPQRSVSDYSATVHETDTEERDDVYMRVLRASIICVATLLILSFLIK